MLQHLGNVFFTLAAIDRKADEEVPTIFLNILNRSSGKVIGQMRFNKDPLYSSANDEIRMAFDVLDPNLLDPISSTILEDIVVGGMVWCSMDNHYLFPYKMKPYMVIHNYPEDPELMQIINSRILNILSELKCTKGAADDNMYICLPDLSNSFLSEKLRNTKY